MTWLVVLNCNLKKRHEGVWNILVFPRIQGVAQLHNDNDLLGNLCSFLHFNLAFLLYSFSIQHCCRLNTNKVLKGI